MPPESLTYERLVAAVEARFGIVIPDERSSAVLRSLQDSCQVIGAIDLAELHELFKSDDARAVDHVIRAATVNHTAFYREPPAYELFAAEILDSIPEFGDVRVWSAASSTGEELYTLAMVAARHVGLSELERRWRFLGTDVDSEAIEHAEEAIYSKERTATLPDDLQKQFLTAVDRDKVQVDDRIRGLCTFRRFNLLARPLPFRHPFNAVFCRNVLYYFSAEHQRNVLEAVHDAVVPGGWLVVSASESIDHLGASWVRRSPISYRRRVA